MLSSICANFAFMKITNKRYLQGLSIAVVVLAIVRSVFPQVAEHDSAKAVANNIGAISSVGNDSSTTVADYNNVASTQDVDVANDSAQLVADVDNAAMMDSPRPIGRPSLFFNADGTQVKNRIYSVPNFGKAFPDQNDVQLVAANRHGVKAVIDRNDAERRKSELVYVGSSPFYHVDRLKSSIPYLVPRAAELLQDIGSSFFDSLQTKQIPLHKIIVTSVLRSKEDVAKLRSHNGNATENSCHLYGTTFDICYNRYRTVEDPDGPQRRRVRNDSLKWVLSEVLRDMRQQGRCHIKYEVHQGCFHITVK